MSDVRCDARITLRPITVILSFSATPIRSCWVVLS